MGGDQHEESCASQALQASLVGVAAGIFTGAAVGVWRDSTPAESGNMLRYTGSMMKKYSALFVTIGGGYTLSKCAIAEIRQSKDFINGTLAGCLTGAAITLRTGQPSAIIGGCAAFAVAGSVMEAYDSNPFRRVPSNIPGYRNEIPKIRESTTQKEISE